jgi:hypothetical protein
VSSSGSRCPLETTIVFSSESVELKTRRRRPLNEAAEGETAEHVVVSAGHGFATFKSIEAAEAAMGTKNGYGMLAVSLNLV